MTGTSNGKSDKIDLRCDGTIALVLKAGSIPNTSGVFSTTIAAATMAKLGGQSCVLRAVPAGSKATTSPAFAGPRLLVGDVRLVTVKGGPSNGAVVDYRVRAPPAARPRRLRVGRQLRRRGLGDVLAELRRPRPTSSPAPARLANTIGAQSAIQVDGAERVHLGRRGVALHRRRRRAPTCPACRRSRSRSAPTRRPATRRSASPRSSSSARPTRPRGPSTRPPAPASRASGVRLDRTITQGRDGRLASVIDTLDEHRRPAPQAERDLRERRDQRRRASSSRG